MSTPADTQKRLSAANPAPAGAVKPGTAWSTATLLKHIDARSEDMQTQDKPITSTFEPRRLRATRRLVASFAGALAMVAAVVVAVVLLGGGDQTSQYEDAARAGDAQAVLGIFAESYRTGDVETALSYADPDMTITAQARNPGYRWLPGLIAFEGVIYGRDDPGASVCTGPNEAGFVQCTFAESPDSPLVALGVSEVTWVARVENGLIVSTQHPGVLVGDVILQRVRDTLDRPIGEYAREIDPEGLATHCDQLAAFEQDINVFSPVVFNEQCASFLVDFVGDFVASQQNG